MNNLKKWKANFKAMNLNRLQQTLSSLIVEDHPLAKSMNYSLLQGGKRLRAQLYLSVRELYGELSDEDYLFASAIECIHTYSLIHDDLPSMDDDVLRRGQPTNHVIFGEAMAILAGDALLNLGFEILLGLCTKNPNYSKSALFLANNCGYNGLLRGQVLDLDLEKMNDPKKRMHEINQLKTANLIAASIECAAILEGEEMRFRTFSNHIGHLFQLQDDLFDQIKSEEEMGKKVKKDAQMGKDNYVTLYGIDQTKKKIEDMTHEILNHTEFLKENSKSQVFFEILEKILYRTY